MPPIAWRSLALIATAMEAGWREAGGGLRRGRTIPMRRTMARAEVDATVDVLLRVPAAVEAWSEGAARLAPLRIRTIDTPVRSLTPIGDGRWWVGPDDVRAAIEEHAPPGEVDAIFVLWPSDGAVPLCGWGCTVGPGPATNGAGFSSIISDGWAGYPERLHPEEGFVHEWLHQVESVLRARGVGRRILPDLHDVDGRTSSRSADLPPYGLTYPEHHRSVDTWQPWYRDLMTGTVRGRDPGEPASLGLLAASWARSRP